MIAIGIGSQAAATVEDVAALIDAAEAKAGVRCDVVATLARGEPDSAIARAAESRMRPVQLLTADELRARAADCQTESAAARAAYGVPSVAEACALAACGAGSRLILARIQHPRVTAAIAASASHALKETTP